MTISTRFPFGFFRHWFEQQPAPGEQNEFVVYPKLGKMSALWKARHHDHLENRHRHRFRPGRLSGEFLGIRPWQQGDSQKWVHWRASARHQSPVVRQFEQHQNHDLAVFVDLFHAPAAENALDKENFELAVSLAATLVSETIRSGNSRIYFVTSHVDEEAICGASSTPMGESVFYRLALAEPEQEDALAENLLKAIAIMDSSAEFILVTPQPLNPATSPRFEKVRNDPQFHPVLQRLRIVDTSDQNLEQFFEI